MILFRTPNLIKGDFEWHMAVIKKDGRTGIRYYFRPLSRVAYRWKPVTSWPGKKPPLWYYFQSYRRSVNTALASERKRVEAVQAQPVGVVRRLVA